MPRVAAEHEAKRHAEKEYLMIVLSRKSYIQLECTRDRIKLICCLSS